MSKSLGHRASSPAASGDNPSSEVIEVAARLPRALVEAVILQAIGRRSDPGSRRLALAKWVIASRRRRAGCFPDLRLGEPVWDMILDLYAAEAEGRRLDVSSLCLASGVPPTTALRYVDLLVAGGQIAKVGDSTDGRRAFVTMQAPLRLAMEAWLDRTESELRLAGWASRPGEAFVTEHKKAANRRGR